MQIIFAKALLQEFEKNPNLSQELYNLLQQAQSIQRISILDESKVKDIKQILKNSGTQDVTVRNKSEVDSIIQEQ